jgi:hypothetical protein
MITLATRSLPPTPRPSPNHPDDSYPVSEFHYSRKDMIWVRQAIAASAGSLLASRRRLRQHLNSLPPDSQEARAIQAFLRFGA